MLDLKIFGILLASPLHPPSQLTKEVNLKFLRPCPPELASARDCPVLFAIK